MTDRELLELAAKAASLEIHVWGTPGEENVALMPCGKRWNPLVDDGDAFRLAVRFGMPVVIDNYVGYSCVRGFEGSTRHDGDPEAATRRAIVRAAAQIGKGM